MMHHVMKRLVDYLEADEQTNRPWTPELFQEIWGDVTRGTVSIENETMQVTTDKYKGDQFTITTAISQGGDRLILLNYNKSIILYRTQIYEVRDRIELSTLRLRFMDMQKIMDVDIQRDTNHDLRIDRCADMIITHYGFQAYFCIGTDGQVFLKMGNKLTKYTPTQSPPDLHVITAFCIRRACKLLGDTETITVSSTDDSISIAFTKVQS